jgi:hypothetical protein
MIVGFVGVGFFAIRRAGKPSSTSPPPWPTGPRGSSRDFGRVR